MKAVVSTVLAMTVLPHAAASNYKEEKGQNCWSKHGAEEIDTYPIGSMSVEACLAKCDSTEACTGVTVMLKNDACKDSSCEGSCWRRKEISLNDCQSGTKFDTWVKNAPLPPTPPSPTPPSPPTPSGQFPGTNPAFMKAFVEGLLSDNGSDAKKCEGDVGSFASAMENLGKTAVGSAKAVAAAIETAKERCTPVAKDALKLAGSALGDFFHPGRIGKNYQATRSDVLTEIGTALECLAKKDFKGAGDNVGKMNRRIIEGPQELVLRGSTQSSYTTMRDLNCYTGHGATDLEKEAGEPCGEMSLSECEQKCDELDACQGITVSSKSGSNKVLCYRRGSINVGQCDHDAQGYTTLLNTKASLPEASNTVGSIVMYVVTYWSAAAMTQDNLASESPEDWGSFVEGLLEGLMSDGTDFSDCQAQIPDVFEAVKAAKQKVGSALAAAMTAAQIAKHSCGVVTGDVVRLAKAAFNDLKHPDQVMQNFQTAQYNILTYLGEAFIALAKDDYSTAGNDMGMAFRRVIEGKQTTTVIV